MPAPDFGVTASEVHARFFPAYGAFSVTSRPTATAVADIILDAGAEVAGALAAAGLDWAAIDADNGSLYPVSFRRCANATRLFAAIQIQTAIAGADEVSEDWIAERETWFKRLAVQGTAAMPDGPAVSQQPMGPRTHIGKYALDTGEDTDPSELNDRFRRDDLL